MSLIVIPLLLRRPPANDVRWWIHLIGHFPFVGLPIVASIATGNGQLPEMTHELIDVLTADGAFTGIVKPKPDVHRDGDWHRSAHVWIVASDGRVLLQRRALVKDTWPGLWDVSVAGHVAAGESSIDAAIRETFEEIGLTIASDELIPIGALTYHCALRDGYVENEFHDVYLLRRDLDLASLVLDPLEVAEVEFVWLEDLERYERVPHEEEYALLRSLSPRLRAG